MEKMFKPLFLFFDKKSFKFKTNFLIFIIAYSTICIVILSQLAIFTIKNDFDFLFENRTNSLIKLEVMKDIYNVNIQDTLKDLNSSYINYNQAKEVVDLAQQLLSKNWISYKKFSIQQEENILKRFIKNFLITKIEYSSNKVLKENLIKNIDKKFSLINEELKEIKRHSKDFSKLNLDINAISIYITSLINYDLSIIIEEKRNTQKVFNTLIILSAISVFIVFLFSIILSIFIINNFKKLNKTLEKKVEEKTKELTEINDYLEVKVSKEVEQNRKKDIIMFQQARLASLGEMLNNIAHQWRQPLGSITMIVQSFQTKIQHKKLTDEFVNEKVNDALLLASNMSNTLDDFKNFFSPKKVKSKFSLKECLEHSIELSKYLLSKENIEVKLHIKKNIQINGYYNELSHVILNMISNSKDALLKNVQNDERIIKILATQYKEFAYIYFIDNGGGIKEEIIPKIFEPYYTTKYKSAGTGIGLYMSKQIIERHMKGKISFKNISHKIKDKKRYNCSLFIVQVPIEEKDINEKL